MRRLALLLLPAAAACAAPAAASAAATAGPASVRLAECTPALEPEARTAHLRGARARRPGHGAARRPLHAADPRAGRAGLAQGRRAGARHVAAPPTTASAATATSRASATSRRRPRTGRSCASAGSTRPARSSAPRAAHVRDLPPGRPAAGPPAAQRVEAHPAANPRDRRYVVFVRNAGRTLAPPASVTLRVGRPPAPAGHDALRVLPGATRRIAFTAPACAAGDELEVTADRERPPSTRPTRPTTCSSSAAAAGLDVRLHRRRNLLVLAHHAPGR